MVAYVATIRVNTTGLFIPGHAVYRWCAGVTRELTVASLAEAPERTGRLKASIRGDTDWAGPHQVTMKVAATAPHATFVHEGTAQNGLGYIVPKKPGVTRLGPMSGDGPRYARRVHGQRANPFLVHGYRLVAQRHRALPRLTRLGD